MSPRAVFPAITVGRRRLSPLNGMGLVIDRVLDVTRTVEVTGGVPLVGVPVGLSLAVGVRDNPGDEEDPRGGPGRVLLSWDALEPVQPRSGWALTDTLTGEAWHVTSSPKPLRLGPRTLAWRSDGVRADALYPERAIILNAQGAIQQEDVPLNRRADTTPETDVGEYRDYVGELPVEFAAWLAEPNVALEVDGVTLRVLEHTPMLANPRVDVRLRRA